MAVNNRLGNDPFSWMKGGATTDGADPSKETSAKETSAKKTTAKKATAKKATAQKATAKKATAQKATAKKATAKSAATSKAATPKAAAKVTAPTSEQVREEVCLRQPAACGTQFFDILERAKQTAWNPAEVLESLPTPVLVTSLSGVALYANPAFLKLSGYAAAELPDLTLETVLAPNDTTLIDEAAIVARLAEAGASARYTAWLVRKAGARGRVEVVRTVGTSRDGTPGFYFMYLEVRGAAQAVNPEGAGPQAEQSEAVQTPAATVPDAAIARPVVHAAEVYPADFDACCEAACLPVFAEVKGVEGTTDGADSGPHSAPHTAPQSAPHSASLALVLEPLRATDALGAEGMAAFLSGVAADGAQAAGLDPDLLELDIALAVTMVHRGAALFCGSLLYTLLNEGGAKAAKKAAKSGGTLSLHVSVEDAGAGRVAMTIAEETPALTKKLKLSAKKSKEAAKGLPALVERIVAVGGSLFLIQNGCGASLKVVLPALP